MIHILTSPYLHIKYEDMDLSQLTIKQIEVLATIIELKSVSKAASSLDLSQSNVSHTLARARVILEDPIVFQEQGKMEPSHKASGLVSRANEILKLARVDCDGQSRSVNGLDKTIRIYCPPDFVEIYGTSLMAALRAQGYKGALSFPRSTEKALKRLEQDPLSLLVRPTAILPPAMVQRKVCEETWTIICSQDHPVRLAGDFSYADALKYEFAVVRAFDGFPNAMDVAAAMRGEKRKICAFVKSYHEMMPFILSGQCISIVPSSVASYLSGIYPICREGVHRISELPPFTTSLAWYPKFTQNGLSTTVRNIVLGVLLQDNG